MVTIFDVAKYLLHELGSMSTWKLQKLCYYCKAWSLSLGRSEMFPERFEAWADGPVSKPLFDLHKGKYTVSEEDIPLGDANRINSDDSSIIEVVIKRLGKLSGGELRKRTHREYPWNNARGELPEDAYCSNVISNEDMFMFYYHDNPDYNDIENEYLLNLAKDRMSRDTGEYYTMGEVMEMAGITMEDVMNAEDAEFDVEYLGM